MGRGIGRVIGEWIMEELGIPPITKVFRRQGNLANVQLN